MLPVALDWSGNVVTRYVFISRFVDDAMFSYHGASGSESSVTLCLEEVHQVAVPVGRQTTTVFGRMRHWGEVCSPALTCWC